MNVAYLPGDALPSNTCVIRNEKDESNSVSPACSAACVIVDLPLHPYSRRCVSGARLYYPRTGDVVVGTIIAVFGDGYRVDINSAFDATLDSTAFNHATKQNRPRLRLGSHIVARVVSVGDTSNDHLCLNDACENDLTSLRYRTLDAPSPAELSCVDPTDARSWSTGEVYFGEVNIGNENYIFHVPIFLALSLQADDCYILDRLGKCVAFEIAVGANGRIAVRGSSPSVTIFVSQVIQRAIGKTLPEIEHIIQTLKAHYESAHGL